MHHLQLVGIDVSAKTLAVAIEWKGEKTLGLEFTNTAAGHRKLIRRLSKQGRCTRVVLEATGSYSLAVAFAFHEAPRIEVMIVNPKAASHFAKAFLLRSKTDAVDAASLLEFVRRMDFSPWQPPSSERLELRDLSRRMAGLTKMATQEKNRLHATQAAQVLSTLVSNDIQVNINHLQRRIQRMQAKALALIKAHPNLQQALDTIVTVRGIAEKSGIQILAELAVLPQDMGPRQWVAHAGLDPRHNVSGTSVHKPARISKAGNSYLRRALYMPALAGAQFEPRIRAFYEKLLERGKKPLQALVAIMRKLLHALHGMLRHHQPVDGENFHATVTQNA